MIGGGVGGGVGRMVHCNSYSDDQYDCSYQKKAEEDGDEVSSKDTMGFQSNTPCAVLLGFFALRYLSLSREVSWEQRKGGEVGWNVRDGTLQ